MRILYPRCLFFPRFIHATLHAFSALFFGSTHGFGWWLTASGYYQGRLSQIVTPNDLHTDLEFEDIVLSVLDRLCLVPYPSHYYSHVQYHFLRGKGKRSTFGG